MRTVELKVVVCDESESDEILKELEDLNSARAGVVLVLQERQATSREEIEARKIRG